MGAQKKVEWRGRSYEGSSVGFEPQGEQWVVFRLDNGGTLRLRVVLEDVVLVDQPEAAVKEPMVLAKSITLLAYEPPGGSDGG